MTTIVIIALLFAALLVLGYWLLVHTEGVYLGQRVVIALYDFYARRYDSIKAFDERADFIFLSAPLLKELQPYNDPLVLDVATGTGRLPLALCRHPNFEGHIVGLDLSPRMLNIAAKKLAQHQDNITLLHAPAQKLPFPNDLFDLVTCLEALEFTPHPAETLRELIRVLRPGGLLLITNRFNMRLMPGKLWSDEQLCALLEEYGVIDVAVELWQADYKQVWGHKAGQSAFTGAIPLDGLLTCPHCGGGMEQINSEWVCRACDAVVSITEHGVIELLKTRQPV